MNIILVTLLFAYYCARICISIWNLIRIRFVDVCKAIHGANVIPHTESSPLISVLIYGGEDIHNVAFFLQSLKKQLYTHYEAILYIYPSAYGRAQKMITEYNLSDKVFLVQTKLIPPQKLNALYAFEKMAAISQGDIFYFVDINKKKIELESHALKYIIMRMTTESNALLIIMPLYQNVPWKNTSIVLNIYTALFSCYPFYLHSLFRGKAFLFSHSFCIAAQTYFNDILTPDAIDNNSFKKNVFAYLKKSQSSYTTIFGNIMTQTGIRMYHYIDILKTLCAPLTVLGMFMYHTVEVLAYYLFFVMFSWEGVVTLSVMLLLIRVICGRIHNNRLGASTMGYLFSLCLVLIMPIYIITWGFHYYHIKKHEHHLHRQADTLTRK